MAPALVKEIADLAAWTLDRRENGLEDTTGFEVNDADRAFAYYFLDGEVRGRRFAPLSDDAADFAHEWGINVAFSDLHQVVLAARDGGRRGVILGGHSAGAVQVPTYAVWDFEGPAGGLPEPESLLPDGRPVPAHDRAGGSRRSLIPRRECASHQDVDRVARRGIARVRRPRLTPR